MLHQQRSCAHFECALSPQQLAVRLSVEFESHLLETRQMSLFGPKKYAELRNLEEIVCDGAASQVGDASSISTDAAVAIVPCLQQPCAIMCNNALPLLLSPLNPPVSLKRALFCGLMTDHSHSSHIDASDGGDSMFAFHCNTRHYIRRGDAPPPPPPHVKRIDYKSEWECEQGIIWPKNVNYACQCSKGHDLTSSSTSVSFSAAITPSRPLPCRVCGQHPSLPQAFMAPAPPVTCRYCDYVVCQACVNAVTPHAHQPPPPPPPFLLHRGVRLEVIKQFKQNWGHVYGRWTTEQVNTFSIAFPVPRSHLPPGLPATHQTSHCSIARQLL